MKKNDVAILTSVSLYSFLFYKQSAGLNFLLFSILIIILLIYRDNRLLRNAIWLSIAVGALISSFFIFKYGSNLAIIANLFSLAILSALSINSRNSFLTGVFLTLCSVASSCYFMFADWINRQKRELKETYKRPFHVQLFLILIPFLITVLFFFFYQNANPLFYNLTKNINLDFISVGWIFFMIGGLLLMYGFFHNTRLGIISDIDTNASLTLTPEVASRKNFLNDLMRIDTEMISGIVLFLMLNSVLLIVNILDLNYLWFDGQLPEGIKHKEFVHNGIGSLITSIIIAILILLFYFRGNLNFHHQNRWLKLLAYIWIVQNIFMIFSTAYRNDMYIDESGLSYKKIGVYVYLILVLIGLVTTFVKLWKIKTNWYLFRVNAFFYYYILVFACIFNWDVIITNFNIKKYTDEKKELEKYFLLDISYKNLPQLLSLPDSVISKDDYKARDYYHYLRGVYFSSFKTGLSKKVYTFLDNYYSLEWQSLCTEKNRVYNELYSKREGIQSLNFDNYCIQSFQPLKMFVNLRSLSIDNCDCSQFDLPELKMFPKLESLTLKNNKLDTLNSFPLLTSLQKLDISDNNIDDISRLENLNNLKEINLSGNPIKDYSLLSKMKNLEKVTVTKMHRTKMDTLKATLAGINICVENP